MNSVRQINLGSMGEVSGQQLLDLMKKAGADMLSPAPSATVRISGAKEQFDDLSVFLKLGRIRNDESGNSYAMSASSKEATHVLVSRSKDHNTAFAVSIV